MPSSGGLVITTGPATATFASPPTSCTRRSANATLGVRVATSLAYAGPGAASIGRSGTPLTVSVSSLPGRIRLPEALTTVSVTDARTEPSGCVAATNAAYTPRVACAIDVQLSASAIGTDVRQVPIAVTQSQDCE